ncbi:MAG: hypothetical protein HOQ22_08615 [Nocardioidaceae bacterium]|nr:hypothetical protein [Nocardioidaceae bacterium]NUS51082.1 hypothetical protein [Nocardioidaceae bacterium]
MPYRVYEASEFEALAQPAAATGSDEPRANRYMDALNRLEEEGYHLVAVDTTGASGLYVFHRRDDEPRPKARISDVG